jgi:hypothetical protein
MTGTLAGARTAQGAGPDTPKTLPAYDGHVVRRQGPVSGCYAAELPVEALVLDDFVSEDDEDDEEEDDEESDVDEPDVDDFEADAGELLDEEPRLSLR